MPLNRQIVLDSRPARQSLRLANFRLVETPTQSVGPGQIQVRQHYLSLDPYMRGGSMM